MNLVFSKEAVLDLRQISRFSRRTYGKRQAIWYIGQIEHYCDALAAGRYRGRSAAAVSPGLRRQLAESHVIFFRILRDDLVVVRVLHEAMNPENHL